MSFILSDDRHLRARVKLLGRMLGDVIKENNDARTLVVSNASENP